MNKKVTKEIDGNDKLTPLEKNLLHHLHVALDGTDGYECEHGSLDRYWSAQKVNHARAVLKNYAPSYTWEY
jgi:hypothetical protein